MRQVHRSAVVPCTPEQMFELVADVTQYPEFLPFCHEAEMLSRDEEHLSGRITVSQGPLHATFTTRNQLDPPHAMTLELVDGPFSQLHGDWRFDAVPQGCRAELRLQFGFSSRVKEMLLGAAFEQLCDRLVDAFVKRARELYGHG